MRADLRGYQFFHFKAKGKGALVLRMAKESIVQWQDQYKTTVQLDENGKDYYIPLSAFRSDKFSSAFVPDDIKIVMFSMEAAGITQNVELTLSEVGFLKQYSPSTAVPGVKLSVNQLNVYPNPGKAGDLFTADFISASQGELSLSICNLMGQVLYSAKVELAKGFNAIPFYLDAAPGVYMLSVKREHTEPQVIKLLIQ